MTECPKEEHLFVGSKFSRGSFESAVAQASRLCPAPERHSRDGCATGFSRLTMAMRHFLVIRHSDFIRVFGYSDFGLQGRALRAVSTAFRDKSRMTSNCFPASISLLTIQVPPHAITFGNFKYSSTFSGVIPPVGIKRIIG